MLTANGQVHGGRSKSRFGATPPDAGSRFGERRSVPRFAFIAPLEIHEPITHTHVSGHVTEISQKGCRCHARLRAIVASATSLPAYSASARVLCVPWLPHLRCCTDGLRNEKSNPAV
jgi:hypothetical protein